MLYWFNRMLLVWYRRRHSMNQWSYMSSTSVEVCQRYWSQNYSIMKKIYLLFDKWRNIHQRLDCHNSGGFLTIKCPVNTSLLPLHLYTFNNYFVLFFRNSDQKNDVFSVMFANLSRNLVRLRNILDLPFSTIYGLKILFM